MATAAHSLAAVQPSSGSQESRRQVRAGGARQPPWKWLIQRKDRKVDSTCQVTWLNTSLTASAQTEAVLKATVDEITRYRRNCFMALVGMRDRKMQTKRRPGRRWKERVAGSARENIREAPRRKALICCRIISALERLPYRHARMLALAGAANRDARPVRLQKADEASIHGGKKIPGRQIVGHIFT